MGVQMTIPANRKRSTIARAVSETGAGILQTLGAVPANPRKQTEPPVGTIARPTVPRKEDLRLIRQMPDEELDYQKIINNPRSGLHARTPRPEPKPKEEAQPEPKPRQEPQPEPKPQEEPQPERATHRSRIRLPDLSAEEIAATFRELKDLPAPKEGEKSLLSEARKKLVVDFYRVHKHPNEVARLTGIPVQQVVPIMNEYRASVVARFDQLRASGLTWREIEDLLGHSSGILIRWGNQAHGNWANPKS
jgi:hypothetical protein